MLLRLPLEIKLSIFKQLELDDKLNLKTTCSKLNELITKAVLYEELDLLKTRYRLKHYEDRDKVDAMIIQKLIKDKFDGSPVKMLHFDPDKLPDRLIGQLSNLFPNVTRISTSRDPEFQSAHQYGLVKRKRGKAKTLKKWRDTIETIDSSYDWVELVEDLLVSTYPRLTDLRLYSVDDLLKKCIGKGPFSLFTNAPALTHLILFDADITFEILEALHVGFPLLQHLGLFSCELEMKKDEKLPPDIVPATTVTYLVLFRSIGFNSKDGALDYVLKKYPNVKQLIYGIDPDKEVRVKTKDDFGLEDFSYTGGDEEIDSMIARVILESTMAHVYFKSTETWFFSQLPKSVMALNLDINNMENAIAALAKSNSKIKIINMLDQNTSSDRVWKDATMLDHFNKLTALQTLKIPLHSSVQKSTTKFMSLNVTKLVINFNGDTFYMDWILSMFPVVEEIHINPPRCSDIPVTTCELKGKNDDGKDNKDTKEIENKKVYPKLRFLSVMKCKIHPGLFDFIKHAAPNLDELNLDLIRLPVSKTKTCKYNLSNWNLNTCNILFEEFRYIERFIYIFITIQNVSKYLVFDSLLNSVKSVGQYYDLHAIRTWLELTVDPIPNLNIGGFPIVKIGDKILIDL